MKARHKRFVLVGLALGALSVAAMLILNAFEKNLVFFVSPSELRAEGAPLDRLVRIGGMVENDSVRRHDDGLTIEFVVTDMAERVPVLYKGLLPDLFREGQGVVAQGRLNSEGFFVASQVLAKHDETYMPPEAAAALAKGKAAADSARSMPTISAPATSSGGMQP